MLLTVIHPIAVIPVIVIDVIDHRCGIGSFFGIKSNRVGFYQDIILLRFDLKFIKLALADTGNKNIPHAAGRMLAHYIDAAVPVVEISDHADTFGIGSPDGKTDAFDPVHFGGMGTKFFIHLKMISLREKIDIHIAEERRKTIRVFRFINASHIIFNSEFVSEIFSCAEVNLVESTIIQTGHKP